MTTKVDIKKILSKGLTGKEAAKLILQDNWLVDHSKEGILSERDISSIKVGLKTTQDIDDYNRLVGIYKLVDYSLKEANILALEAQKYLLLATRELEKYLLEDQIRWIQVSSLPAIVTQKQYEELKTKQRENKLKETFNLKQILEKRAEEITSEDLRDEWENEEDNSYEYQIDFLHENYPDLWKQIVSSVLEFIKSGKLKPVQISSKGQARLEKIWQEIREAREDDGLAEARERVFNPTSETFQKIMMLNKEEEKIIRELYLEGRDVLNQDNLISSLEQLITGSLSEDEEFKLVEFTFCSGEDLYQTGLPEWIQEVDKYYPNLDDETMARPEGMMQSFSVAIIQDPDPEDLDERGYWIDKDPLSKISGYEREISPSDFFLNVIYNASEKIKYYLAIQVITEAASKIVGVNFAEDLDKWYEETQILIDLYNALLTPRSKFLLGQPNYLGMPRLDSLKIGKLKPTAKSLKYYQERMALALGKDWIKEAIQALELEADEKDSLAQDAADDLTIIRKAGSQEEALKALIAKDKQRVQEASDG